MEVDRVHDKAAEKNKIKKQQQYERDFPVLSLSVEPVIFVWASLSLLAK